MQLLSIDLGYGHTKFMYNGECFKFPTAISHAGISSTSFAATESYQFEGHHYFVGDEKAIREALPTRDYSFLEKYAPLLIYKALEICIEKYELDPSKDIHIATGLSVMNWAQREDFKKRIRKFEVNGKIINTHIKLFAQGQGVFYDYFDVSGDDDLNIVLDIGLLTNDFIVFENNKPYNEKCFANDQGLNIIITNLQNYISANFDDTRLPEAQINKILVAKEYRHYGQVNNLEEVIANIKHSYINDIVLGLQANSKALIKEAKKIILSGGGAYLFEDLKIFPNLVLSNAPFEFANVRGYYAKSPILFKDEAK